MSASLPHAAAGHALAVALIEIERNLERLRASDDLKVLLELDLNDEDRLYHGPDGRARRLEEFATREIDLQGCTVRPTQDR